jgi:hypothetical protein
MLCALFEAESESWQPFGWGTIAVLDHQHASFIEKDSK